MTKLIYILISLVNISFVVVVCLSVCGYKPRPIKKYLFLFASTMKSSISFFIGKENILFQLAAMLLLLPIFITVFPVFPLIVVIFAISKIKIVPLILTPESLAHFEEISEQIKELDQNMFIARIKIMWLLIFEMWLKELYLEKIWYPYLTNIWYPRL